MKCCEPYGLVVLGEEVVLREPRRAVGERVEHAVDIEKEQRRGHQA